MLTTMLMALAGAQELPDMSGSWLLEYRVVTKNRIAIVGDIRSRSSNYVLVELERTDKGWTQGHRVCGAEVNGAVVRSELPAAYLEHVPVKRYPVDLRADAGKVRLTADFGPFVTGYDPERCSAPPEVPDSPCVIDWDEDGNPGATVKVKVPLFRWTDVYLAQRNHLGLDGTVSSRDRVDGRVVVHSMATKVLGAANKLFARSPTAALVPDESHFAMKRLAADATCRHALDEIARGSLLDD